MGRQGTGAEELDHGQRKDSQEELLCGGSDAERGHFVFCMTPTKDDLDRIDVWSRHARPRDGYRHAQKRNHKQRHQRQDQDAGNCPAFMEPAS